MGMAAYYHKAWHLWFTHSMERFVVSCGNEDMSSERADATEMLAVRIRNFGGALQELAPGASLDRNDLRVVTCRSSSRLAYLSYVTRSLLRANWSVPGVELAYSEKVRCDYGPRDANDLTEVNRVYVEADGELVGTLPAEVTIIPDALTLLAPQPRN
jgi:diacylglycerol kinase (ATP)